MIPVNPRGWKDIFKSRMTHLYTMFSEPQLMRPNTVSGMNGHLRRQLRFSSEEHKIGNKTHTWITLSVSSLIKWRTDTYTPSISSSVNFILHMHIKLKCGVCHNFKSHKFC